MKSSCSNIESEGERILKVAVIGATGFVGSAVCEALIQRGHEVVRLTAPRIDGSKLELCSPTALTIVREELRTCDSLVNAAGVSEARGTNLGELTAANGILPGIMAKACADEHVRFIHVSSAAVQGRRDVLDAAPSTAPFSPYSESKAQGEAEALHYGQATIYRPPGVHGADRAVTQAIARLARSGVSSVAGDGSRNSAQALIDNVADAIAFLATCEEAPPSIVSHPSEGLTTASLLNALGGKSPVQIPRAVASCLVATAFGGSKIRPRLAGQARRLEMLWFGQRQAESWLTGAGWSAPHQRDTWRELGRTLAGDADWKDTE